MDIDAKIAEIVAKYRLDPPDLSLDQDVQRYSRAVEAMHREIAEARALAEVKNPVNTKRTKKDPK
jgi:hypothetical protein